RRNNLYRHSRPRRSHPSTGFLINNSAPFFARRALRFLTDVYTYARFWQRRLFSEAFLSLLASLRSSSIPGSVNVRISVPPRV
ncbi:hypothetical protein, partial [Thalassoglobus neptunius]|uniref:hypothetical protein n=1 Tax=Thalassoglobus neptunius TaxID=1938619 RepID=UPI001E423CFC